MSTELVIPSNQLILCHPFLLLPSNFLSIRVFSSESALFQWVGFSHQVAKILELQPVYLQPFLSFPPIFCNSTFFSLASALFLPLVGLPSLSTVTYQCHLSLLWWCLHSLVFSSLLWILISVSVPDSYNHEFIFPESFQFCWVKSPAHFSHGSTTILP